MDRKEEKIDGWLDGSKKYMKKWIFGWIKNRWMVGWIEKRKKKDGWLEG